ncbi:type II toxin-antitoxin system RelE/ParE family toxin [Collinsella tanakaei]|uniref:type II toxin-antitoxin system RelE/ParE family toxin n=1 Tax=Collinsella tanakaei TaxID=626935 RepID=UPI00195B95F4|nr:type II toxin-antitoxin system RelE/ParE family toxin [Collinsella tanakaei]MBM6779780.1 type II toxin-antitoxin system RelE/ParE family toxin [Collinsella tanakaei]
MAYRIVITAPAKRQLAEIVNYLVQDCSAPRAARSLLDSYRAVRKLISALPYPFPVDEVVSSIVGDSVRKANVDRYRAYFIVEEKDHVVAVVAFLHGSQDQRRHFPLN